MWHEALALVKSAAAKVPEVPYIGWDVAISRDGPVIVEGNAGPLSFTVRQLDRIATEHKGVYEELSNTFEAMLFMKTLTENRIRQVNAMLFEHTGCYQPYDVDRATGVKPTYIVVLGSRSCEYRIEQAYERFKGQNVTFILSGGNPTAYWNGEIEAHYMKRFLTQKGITADKILMEDQSHNSVDNVNNVIRLIECTISTTILCL